MRKRIGDVRKSTLYTIIGFLFGCSAPIGWSLFHAVFLPQAELSFWAQVLEDVTRNSYQIALYLYMGVGTAIVMGGLAPSGLAAPD